MIPQEKRILEAALRQTGKFSRKQIIIAVSVMNQTLKQLEDTNHGGLAILHREVVEIEEKHVA